MINNTNSRKSLMIINNIKKTKSYWWYNSNRKAKKKISTAKSNPKQTKQKPKPKKKVKSFEEYFQECIKNKTIPGDTLSYLKKALERALKEYQQGIKKDKSAFENFAEKYIVDREAKVIPIDFFVSKSTQLKDFLRNHRNIKTCLVLICLMEKQSTEKRKTYYVQDRAYFNLKFISIVRQQMEKNYFQKWYTRFSTKFLFFKKMLVVGILKKYSVLKFTLLVINQWKGLLTSHLQILS